MPEMIIRTGIDVETINRVMELKESIRKRFVARVLTPAELDTTSFNASHFTGLFCAKEAIAKALGCGIGPISWKEIEIVSDANGSPQVVLTGSALLLAEGLGVTGWSLSITHTNEIAAAVAVGFGQK